MALARGASPERICEIFEVTANHLRVLEKDLAFQSLLTSHQNRFDFIRELNRGLVEEITGNALQVLHADIQNPDSKTRIESAKTFAKTYLEAHYRRESPEPNTVINQSVTLHINERLEKLVEIKARQPVVDIEADSHFVP